VYGDLFETYCSVDDDGYFEFAIIMEDDVQGMEYAFAVDLSGAWSNIRQDDAQIT
jgi:hypothetical protein